jgi:hypothetical protein
MRRHDRTRWLAVAALPALLGCGTVIGEWFDGYAARADHEPSDAGAIDGASPADDSGPAPAIEGCKPTMIPANGVTYPATASLTPLEIKGPEPDAVDTDGPRCFDDGTPRAYCMLLARDLHVLPGAVLRAHGSRPLVIVTAFDMQLDGDIDVSATDTGDVGGPGAHPGGGSGSSGGGNAGGPGGSSCGVPGGTTTERGLVGGGPGGPVDASPNCRVGGAGGGALQLVSLCGTIFVNQTISATGGIARTPHNGTFDPACPAGAGGGSGGTVWLQAVGLRFKQGSGGINIWGGGGAGGACHLAPEAPWVLGGSAVGTAPGLGGDCTNGVRGGNGGVGGNGADAVPGKGTEAVASPPAQGSCGGGGGARGRVIVQVPGLTCEDVSHDGSCFVEP